MKNFNKFLALFMATTLFAFMTSCDEDDPIGPIIDPTDTTEVILVADGYYITLVDGTAAAANVLNVENVEDGLASIERVDFYANYLYLTAGSYNLLKVADKAIEETLGGTTTAEVQDGDNCEVWNYTSVAVVTDGAGFDVDADGVYKVTYDKTTSEVIYAQVTKTSIIGDATTIGWSGTDNVDVPGTVANEVGTWSLEGVTLRKGNVKMRMNCSWKIQRADYIIFANFGANADSPMSGSLANLTTGNDSGNIVINDAAGDFPNEGVYTVDITFAAATGFSLELTRTGDAEEVTFDPTVYEWGIIGDATQGTTVEGGTDEWGDHKRMAYKQDGSTHIWRGVFPLEADSKQFKFRADGGWANKITPGTDGVAVASIVDNTEDGSISNNSATEADASWFVDAMPGFYYFEIKTEDNGESWIVTLDEAEFGAIGAATPGGWDASTALTYQDDLMSASATMAFTVEEYKFRVNGAWDFSLGGALDALEFDGGNLSMAEAGDKTVTITTADGGQSYTATVE